MRIKIIFFGLGFERILVLSISCSFCIKNKKWTFRFYFIHFATIEINSLHVVMVVFSFWFLL